MIPTDPAENVEAGVSRPISVLVTAASRHGGTAELASTIAVVLRVAGLTVDVRDPGEIDSVTDYDALVVGSAVYRGSWLPDARQLLERFSRQLSGRPLWLFSSGPLENWPSNPAQPVPGLPPVVRAAIVDHHVFGGRLTRRRLRMGERLTAGVLGAPDGDFRPWEDVLEWSQHIGDCLTGRGHRAPLPGSALSQEHVRTGVSP